MTDTPPRRIYFLKRKSSELTGDGFEPVWQSKQLAEPGTAIPATMPHKAALEAAGYAALEDFDTGDAESLAQELQDTAGLTPREASAVVAALIA